MLTIECSKLQCRSVCAPITLCSHTVSYTSVGRFRKALLFVIRSDSTGRSNNNVIPSSLEKPSAEQIAPVELKRNLMAHGEAREEKWRGKRRMEWVASTHALYGYTVYPALLPLKRTPRLPAADWTDTPADINGLVRFAGRPNLVSARVPSHSFFTLPQSI